MLLLVDGYNITKADPATRDLSLEAQREALVGRLRGRGREMLGAGTIVVVFDGAGGVGGSLVREGAVEVRYSREESADDVIVRLACGAADRVVLVTSDRTLAERVTAHTSAGSEVRPRETLFDSAAATKRRRRGGSPAGSAGIPRGGNKITEELKKIWLQDEE